MSDQTELPTGSVPLAAALPLASGAQVSTAFAYKKKEPITFQLPDGKQITFDVPKASISELTNSVLAESKVNPQFYPMEQQRVKFLLYITEIDGVQQAPICDLISRARMEEQIGIEFLDGLFVQWINNYVDMDGANIKIVKKS